MNLVAPNSLPITGIRLSNGNAAEFECIADATYDTYVFTVPDGNAALVCDPTILVDSSGNNWSASDVMYHSILHGR